ncbi:MAG TPA: hypothetical protein IAC98_03440 [Candidatus Cryptobacteroides pullicola]|nr:hypothetical protein [Candidatus Cryptobacteroides pullicola]
MTDTMLADKYALFAELMNEARIYLDTGIDFGSVCRYLGLEEAAFDAVLLGELGLCGNEIFSIYRRSEAEMAENLY